MSRFDSPAGPLEPGDSAPQTPDELEFEKKKKNWVSPTVQATRHEQIRINPASFIAQGVQEVMDGSPNSPGLAVIMTSSGKSTAGEIAEWIVTEMHRDAGCVEFDFRTVFSEENRSRFVHSFRRDDDPERERHVRIFFESAVDCYIAIRR